MHSFFLFHYHLYLSFFLHLFIPLLLSLHSPFAPFNLPPLISLPTSTSSNPSRNLSNFDSSQSTKKNRGYRHRFIIIRFETKYLITRIEIINSFDKKFPLQTNLIPILLSFCNSGLDAEQCSSYEAGNRQTLGLYLACPPNLIFSPSSPEKET